MAGVHHVVMAANRGGKAGLGLVNVGIPQTGSNPTVPFPADIAAGDLLIIVGATNGSYSGTPSGWTNSLLNGASTGLTVHHKWYAGTENPPSVGASGASAHTVMIAFRGWSALDVMGSYSSGSGGATASGVTASTTGDLVLSIFGASNNNVNWTSAPNGTVTAFDGGVSGARGLLVCYESWPTATATGTRTASASGGGLTVGGIIIAFKP